MALPTPDSSCDSLDDAFYPRKCTTSCPPGSAYGSADNTYSTHSSSAMPRETVVDPAQTNFHNWFDDVCDLVFGDEAALNQLVKSEEAMDRPEGPVNVNDEVQGSQCDSNY